jgi:hypothetical protein
MEDDIKVHLGCLHWTELHQDSSYCKSLSLFDLATEAIGVKSHGLLYPHIPYVYIASLLSFGHVTMPYVQILVVTCFGLLA